MLADTFRLCLEQTPTWVLYACCLRIDSCSTPGRGTQAAGPITLATATLRTALRSVAQ
ncbi:MULTISPECIES: hypothetical protein [unclassified Streptomyces]|uniref:hypothetical protein n=1 Tax=unclassified Streptomyces TaxID=2593676 RepID=UPI00168A8122|nr:MULTISPECIES: hypothetical protein [unclassified Streptomyces]MBD3005484.1 hypothetical protein [Streptomyces sp. 5-10]